MTSTGMPRLPCRASSVVSIFFLSAIAFVRDAGDAPKGRNAWAREEFPTVAPWPQSTGQAPRRSVFGLLGLVLVRFQVFAVDRIADGRQERGEQTEDGRPASEKRGQQRDCRRTCNGAYVSRPAAPGAPYAQAHRRPLPDQEDERQDEKSRTEVDGSEQAARCFRYRYVGGRNEEAEAAQRRQCGKNVQNRGRPRTPDDFSDLAREDGGDQPCKHASALSARHCKKVADGRRYRQRGKRFAAHSARHLFADVLCALAEVFECSLPLGADLLRAFRRRLARALVGIAPGLLQMARQSRHVLAKLAYIGLEFPD